LQYSLPVVPSLSVMSMAPSCWCPALKTGIPQRGAVHDRAFLCTLSGPPSPGTWYVEPPQPVTSWK